MDSLRSPLTPDVRRGCAARSSALAVHCLLHSASRADKSPPQRRRLTGCPLTSRTPIVVRQAPVSLPRLPRTHRPASSTSDGSPTLARRPPPRRRGQGMPFSLLCRVPSPQARPRRPYGIETHRETRNAQLHGTGGVRLSYASSTLLRSRPGAFLRASAPPGFLNPPRLHSATPNLSVFTTYGPPDAGFFTSFPPVRG